MDSTNILIQIQLSYNQYTKTEKKIADYIIKNSSSVLFMSITELADECGVAEASVHRFCRRNGAKGYQEFKMKLSLCSSGDETHPAESVGNSAGNDDSKDLFAKILQNHLDAIRETNALLRPEMVEHTVNLMINARSIQFFGIGDSLLVAEDARNKFMRITPKVRTISDPHMQAMAASMSGPDDMLFFISYSGSTKDNVYVAKIARAAGAKIAVITRFLKSPLTEYADAVLICGSKEGPFEGGSIGAKMSQLHIIDILFQCYYAKTRKESAENIRKTSGAVADKLF